MEDLTILIGMKIIGGQSEQVQSQQILLILKQDLVFLIACFMKMVSRFLTGLLAYPKWFIQETLLLQQREDQKIIIGKYTM